MGKLTDAELMQFFIDGDYNAIVKDLGEVKAMEFVKAHFPGQEKDFGEWINDSKLKLATFEHVEKNAHALDAISKDVNPLDPAKDTKEFDYKDIREKFNNLEIADGGKTLSAKDKDAAIDKVLQAAKLRVEAELYTDMKFLLAKKTDKDLKYKQALSDELNGALLSMMVAKQGSYIPPIHGMKKTGKLESFIQKIRKATSKKVDGAYSDFNELSSGKKVSISVENVMGYVANASAKTEGVLNKLEKQFTAMKGSFSQKNIADKINKLETGCKSLWDKRYEIARNTANALYQNRYKIAIGAAASVVAATGPVGMAVYGGYVGYTKIYEPYKATLKKLRQKNPNAKFKDVLNDKQFRIKAGTGLAASVVTFGIAGAMAGLDSVADASKEIVATAADAATNTATETTRVAAEEAARNILIAKLARSGISVAGATSANVVGIRNAETAEQKAQEKLGLKVSLFSATLTAAMAYIGLNKAEAHEVEFSQQNTLDNVANPGATPADSVAVANPGAAPADSVAVANPGATPADSVVVANPGAAPADSVVVANPGAAPADSVAVANPGAAPADSVVVANPDATPADSVVAEDVQSDTTFVADKDYMEGYQTPKSDKFFEVRNSDPRFDHHYADGTKVTAKEYMEKVVGMNSDELEGKPEGMTNQDYLYHRNMLKAYVQFEGKSTPLNASQVAALKAELGDKMGDTEGRIITGREATFLKYMANSGFTEEKWQAVLDGNATQEDINKLFESKLGAHAARMLIERDIECGQLNEVQVAIVNRGLADIDMKDNTGYYIGKDSGIGITDNRYIGHSLEDNCNHKELAEHPRVGNGGKSFADEKPDQTETFTDKSDVEESEKFEDKSSVRSEEKFEDNTSQAPVQEAGERLVVQSFEHKTLTSDDLKAMGFTQVTTQEQHEALAKQFCNYKESFESPADAWESGLNRDGSGVAIVRVEGDHGGKKLFVKEGFSLAPKTFEVGENDIRVSDNVVYPYADNPAAQEAWKASNGIYRAEDGKEYIKADYAKSENVKLVQDPFDCKKTIEMNTEKADLTEGNSTTVGETPVVNGAAGANAEDSFSDESKVKGSPETAQNLSLEEMSRLSGKGNFNG